MNFHYFIQLTEIWRWLWESCSLVPSWSLSQRSNTLKTSRTSKKYGCNKWQYLSCLWRYFYRTKVNNITSYKWRKCCCNNKIDCRYYGATSVCYSCRIFFRRVVASKQTFNCIGHNNCQVDKQTRNNCKYVMNPDYLHMER